MDNNKKTASSSCSCAPKPDSVACSCLAGTPEPDAQPCGLSPQQGRETQPCCVSSTTKPDIQPCSCLTINPILSEIRATTSTLTFADRFDHFLARWGVNRMGHLVEPGLYRLGEPTPDSPVFVSANYTLSFDALRSSLAGHDGYILVLDTKGVNVWCAAGEGTFGTDELLRRIESSGAAGVVRHRTLILPQLGAPGISAHVVLHSSGFRVEYGPVRARDLPEYLKTDKATPEMRRVRFPLADRLVLTPIELVHMVLPMVAAAVALYLVAGPPAALAAVTAVLSGTVLFPVLLPIIPTKDFSTKGLILGVIMALPFAAYFATVPLIPGWAQVISGIVPLLFMPAVTSYLALNFTGCTTFTSRTGVKSEIFRYVPVMAFMAGSGVVLSIVLGAAKVLGVI